MQMVGDNGGNQFRQYARQNNLNRNGNLVAARAEGNATRHNGNQIRCYNYKGLGHFSRNCTVRPRIRDATYLQTQLLIAQKEEAGIKLQAKEFHLMAAAADLDEIEEVNANCILMANLHKESKVKEGETTTDITPKYNHNITKEVKEEVKEVINEEESEVETDEEVEEMLKDEEEEEEDKDGEHFNSDHSQSEGQSLHALRPSRLYAQAQSVDDMPFRTQAYTEYTRWVFCKMYERPRERVIRGSKTVSETILKHDLCKLVIAEVRSAITDDGTGSSKPSKERFLEFENNSVVINSGPIKTGVKYLLGGVVQAKMSPDGSIVASLKNFNGFLAVNTHSGDLICTDFEQKGVVPEVMLHILEEFVLLLGRHSLNNKIPRTEENPSNQSRLGILFSKEMFKGGVIRIHNAFVHDEDHTYGKVACITHKVKGQVPVRGNQD
nr:hypothetical protein [Tanacetum cinerariifolium]